jgi:CBS domain-containing protein
MRSSEAARKAPVTIRPEESIARAAQLMDRHAVGAVVVVNEDGSLAGIVTDRDIAVRGVARGAAVDGRIDSLMSTDVLALDADADLRDALKVFRDHAFRRLPLLSEGKVAGMITVDDLAVNLVADLSDLVRPITGEVIFGHPEPAVPVAP